MDNENLAQGIKNTQHGNTMQDLVFNPVTGEFEMKPKGTANAGDVVTDMTKDGFASSI